ncbi:MAG: hypothetical protein EXR52_01190 [Dehalococcoidia bacterium]|nr:hypothetical protein [Dehalococcoidia bacterium]
MIDGSIEQRGALAEEADEPELQGKARLVLHAARGKASRRKQLFHAVNDMGAVLVRRDVPQRLSAAAVA